MFRPAQMNHTKEENEPIFDSTELIIIIHLFLKHNFKNRGLLTKVLHSKSSNKTIDRTKQGRCENAINITYSDL